MDGCRFMHQNLIEAPGCLTLSSARPGLVGMPVPRVRGSAVAYAQGLHTGAQDQVFHLEIDSLALGSSVGQATYRWRRSDSPGWEGGGVPTSVSVRDLAEGVGVKWVSGQGQDFHLGDAWNILAGRNFGPAALLDSDRDTGWESLGCQDQWLEADLGEARRATAFILADHNLSGQAQAWLMADAEPNWQQPAFSLSLAVGGPHLAAFFDQSFRRWRLVLNDPGNPEGALKAGGLYLGPHFQPSRTFGARYVRGLTANRSITSTEAGKQAGSARSLARSWSLAFSGLDQNDLAGFEEMFRAVHDPATGRLRPLWFTPFAGQPQDTLCCLPGQSLEPAHLHQGRYGLSLSLQEMVRSRV